MIRRVVNHAVSPSARGASRDRGGGPGVACALMIGAAVACAGTLQAQTVAPRTQIWVAVGPATRGDAVVHMDAEPPLLLGFVAEARLTAAIPVPQTTSRAIEVGASWFPTRHVGLEAWLATDRGTARLTGGQDHTTLEYVARFPPGPAPRDIVIERDLPLPAMEASIRRWALGLNGAVRWTGSGRITGSASAGLCRIRASGDVVPLPMVSFWLGGHEVPFSEEYGVASTLGPTAAWRPNAGGTLDVRLTRHLALSTRVRRIWSSELALPVRATGIPEPVGMRPTEADLAHAMADSVARVPAATTRLSFGLTVQM